MPRHAPLAAAVALALSSAPLSAGPPADARPDVPLVASDDVEMEAAKRRGRAGLPGFWARFAAPAADESDFFVKFDLTPDTDAEFIWAGDLRRDSDGLSGALANDPVDERFELGQRVRIDEALIIDWSYRKGAVTQGNETTRVLLARATPEEAAEIRQAYGW